MIGGIIPQIEVRDFVEIGDERIANPIKFNIYPIRQTGKSFKSVKYLIWHSFPHLLISLYPFRSTLHILTMVSVAAVHLPTLHGSAS